MFFCFFFFASAFYSLGWDISHLSNDLHNLCLRHLNFETHLSEIYKSLICGKRLPTGHIKEIFVKGGLIHLTVVSGAHLLFLEKFWKQIPLPAFLKTQGLFVILILYALAQPLTSTCSKGIVFFFPLSIVSIFKALLECSLYYFFKWNPLSDL